MAKKSKFDLSHERKLSLNMGQLVPIMLQECLPGDKFRVNTEIMMRLAPMIAPVMHRVNVYTHYFKVPKRLVWNEWQDFITGGKEGDLEPVMPYFAFPQAADLTLSINGSLADYMGLPTTSPSAAVTNPMQVSALPFRAYQLIYNEYYRDQNLSDPIPINKGSGTQTLAEQQAMMAIRKRAWEKGYFESALPWAQRGGAAQAPVDYTPETQSQLVDATTGLGITGALTADATGMIGNGSAAGRVQTDAGVDINELRKAVKVQEWLEKNARGGARYIEVLLSQFDVRSSDARLQRPEYLGGGRHPVVISEVLSTYQNDAQAYPQGNMSGHGIAVGSKHGFTTYCEEHCYIIGILSVLPKSCYQQGVHKLWTRKDKFDFAWPVFANLGEQEVKGSEVYQPFEAPANTPDPTFGYQERYAEYKHGFNTVHGDFRDSLAYWHMGRIFDQQPVLNEDFVMSDPTTRIFAVEDPDVHHLYAQIWHNVSAIRPLPFFGTPRL